MLYCGVSGASLEFVMYSSIGVVAMQYYDRSLTALKSIGAAIQTDPIRVKEKRYSSNGYGYETYMAPVVYGKEKFYHALSVSKAVGTSVIISSEDNIREDFFNYLMGQYDYPL